MCAFDNGFLDSSGVLEGSSKCRALSVCVCVCIYMKSAGLALSPKEQRPSEELWAWPWQQETRQSALQVQL